MSSGFGQQGGRGRCFTFFQEFVNCYSQADQAEECRRQFEDYDECLWHKKEMTRLALVEQEYFKQHPEQKPKETILPNINKGQFAKWHGFGS